MGVIRQINGSEKQFNLFQQSRQGLQLDSASGEYVLGVPLFLSIVMNLENGKIVRIVSRGFDFNTGTPTRALQRESALCLPYSPRRFKAVLSGGDSSSSAEADGPHVSVSSPDFSRGCA